MKIALSLITFYSVLFSNLQFVHANGPIVAKPAPAVTLESIAKPMEPDPCKEDIQNYCAHQKTRPKQIVCLIYNRSKVATACLKLIEPKKN